MKSVIIIAIAFVLLIPVSAFPNAFSEPILFDKNLILEEYAADTGKILRQGAAARQRAVEMFSFATMVDNYARVYRETIGESDWYCPRSTLSIRHANQQHTKKNRELFAARGPELNEAHAFRRADQARNISNG